MGLREAHVVVWGVNGVRRRAGNLGVMGEISATATNNNNTTKQNCCAIPGLGLVLMGAYKHARETGSSPLQHQQVNKHLLSKFGCLS